MTVHEIRIQSHIIHGAFDRSRPPVLTVESSDTVVYETLDASWGRAVHEHFEVPLPDFEMVEEERGHALSGPIEVRGAEPGDVLEVSSRGQALALASLVVDLRITQIVNGTVGVHAVLPAAALASRLQQTP